MFCPGFPHPTLFLFSTAAPPLLYYSHLLTTATVLAIGGYVFIKNRSDLAAKLLFFISLVFSVWAILDIITYVEPSPKIMIFAWAIVYAAEVLIYPAFLYFAYTFLEKKHPPLSWAAVMLLVLLPLFILLPSSIIFDGFTIIDGVFCEAVENNLMGTIFYGAEIFFALWLVFYLLRNICTKEDKKRKEKSFFLLLGAFIFLFSFLVGNVVGSFFLRWDIIQYCIFGMPVFVAFLAYLVVHYQSFNLKLFGAQVLVWGLWILTGSLLLLNDFSVIRIVVAVTLVIFAIMGWSLIRSVRREIQQKEELARLQGELKILNTNLQHTVAEQTVEVRRAYELEHKALLELQAIDAAKTQFILTTQHHLRTPLTIVNGYIQTALSGSFGAISDAIKTSLQKAAEGAETLRRISNELLEVIQFDVGKSILKKTTTTLAAIAESLTSAVSKGARSEGASVEFSFSEDATSAPLFIDTDRITEALQASARIMARHKLNRRIFLSAKIVTDPIEQTEQVQFLFEGAKVDIVPAFQAPKAYAPGSAEKSEEAVDILLVKSVFEAHGGRVWTEERDNTGSLYAVVPGEEREKDIT